MIKEVIILAGGLGTRLKKVISDIPKVMALINGKPFLEYQLNYLEKSGINRVVLSVGYRNEIISKHFKNKYRTIKIDYVIEDEPLGTGGGIKKAFTKIIGNSSFVLNGDTLFEVDMQKMYEFQQIKKTDLCIALRKTDDVSRYGEVDFDNNFKITGFTEKNKKSGKGYINGGFYLINKDYFLNFNLPEKFSIEKDFFERYYKTEDFYGFCCSSYFLDIGIPEDFQKAQNEFKRLKY